MSLEITTIELAGSVPAKAPVGVAKEITIGRSVDAYERGVIAGLLFRNFTTGEIINITPVSYSELSRITRQDGQARGLLRLLTMPITNARWDVLTDQEDKAVTGGAKQKDVVGTTSSDERDLIHENMFSSIQEGGMSIPFSDVVSILSLALRDGFKVFEKVFKLNDRGKVVLKKLAPRSNDTVTLLSDAHGDFNGFRQQASFGGRFIDVSLSKEKSLLYTFGKEEGPLYGAPLFLPVYYHMDKKHKLYYISHVAFQLLAIPPRIGKLPAGATGQQAVKNKFLHDLGSLGFNAAMVIEDGYEVEAFESARTLADFMPMIEHHNTMAAKAVLGQFMDLATSSTGRLAGEQSDIFIMGIVAILHDIEKLFNNWVIPQLIDFDFGSRSYPKLRARAFTDSDQQALREVFLQIMTAGANHCSPEFIAKLERKMAGMMDIKDLDYDKIEADMIAKAEQQQEMLNDQQKALTQARAQGGNPNRNPTGGKPGVGKEGNN